MTTTARAIAPAGAYVRAGLLALVTSATAGGVAGWAHGERFWLVAGVFAACTLGPAIAMGWLVFVSGHVVEPDSHVEDSVESRWMERATAGAFVDVVIAAGVALTLTSLLDLDVPGRLVLLALLGGAGADTVLRFRVLSLREA